MRNGGNDDGNEERWVYKRYRHSRRGGSFDSERRLNRTIDNEV